jgi:uncharacterized protein YbjT (DUF2867 family)
VKIFFRGATGVIGRRAVPQLLALGHDVTAMARSPASAHEGSLETIQQWQALNAATTARLS